MKGVPLSRKKRKIKKARKPKDRLPFLFYLLIVFLLIIGGRLVFIQTVEAERFDGLAEEQRLTKIKLIPERGIIYDRNKEVLAISLDKDTIYANPKQIKQSKKTVLAGKLASILNENKGEMYDKLIQDSGFVYLKRKVDKDVSEKVRKLNVEGIGFLPESQRYYPGQNIASHILGFVGLDNDGLTGIELSRDAHLKGKPGQLIMEQDLAGRPIPGGQYRLRKPTHGSDLVLTIDKEIQYKAQVELKKAVKKWKASGGGIVVMNSKTGEVYAMANYPTYNLNKFGKTDPELFKSRAISDLYEPGSTMKIVTAAAALEEKLYSPSTALNLPGTIQVGGYTIHEAHERGAQVFTFEEIVTRSSNIGAVVLGQSLGKERLYKYIEIFGLTAMTGVELPQEGQGYTPPTDTWSDSTIANIPFGQGLSATSMESIRAINVIASGGRLVSPRFIMNKSDAKKGNNSKENQAELGKQVISPGTAKTMARIMTAAVTSGTGKQATIKGYQVAGKTGTAQKARTDGRGYDPGKYISSFIGFTPAADPELTILVALDEPTEAIYGGVVAGPTFSAVGEYALQRLRIQP
ncbi:MAG TPA: penicillin-binding protein 2 [Actinobacteria bacterium]|nr:penicillin-binding protein 2 [Actinomycetota bacterium]